MGPVPMLFFQFLLKWKGKLVIWLSSRGTPAGWPWGSAFCCDSPAHRQPADTTCLRPLRRPVRPRQCPQAPAFLARLGLLSLHHVAIRWPARTAARTHQSFSSATLRIFFSPNYENRLTASYSWPKFSQICVATQPCKSSNKIGRAYYHDDVKKDLL